MIHRSEMSGQLTAPVSILIERDDGRFEVRLWKSADHPSPSPMPPEFIVPDEITGLPRVRHLPKMVRQ